jgi:hypothetical protein
MKTTLFGALAAGTALTAIVASTAAATDAPHERITSVARSQVGDSNQDSSASPAQIPAVGTVSASGCPVSARVLLRNLRKSKAYERDIAPTKRLTEIHCYHGYATAVTHPKELDSITVVFHYRTTRRTWKVINFGSSQVCDGVVPARVKSHLTGC